MEAGNYRVVATVTGFPCRADPNGTRKLASPRVPNTSDEIVPGSLLDLQQRLAKSIWV